MERTLAGSTLRAALVLSLPAFTMLFGCGSSSPSATSPTPVVVATPAPAGPARTTLSLNAGADQGVYSSSLTRLALTQSFSVEFKLERINTNPTAEFHYAIEFWFTKTPDVTAADYSSDGLVLSMFQAHDTTWDVWVRTPEDNYRNTGLQVQVGVGTPKTLRVLRGPDGSIGFFLDGVSLIGFPLYKEPSYVFARVVGTNATFSFVPGATSTSVGSSPFQTSPLAVDSSMAQGQAARGQSR